MQTQPSAAIFLSRQPMRPCGKTAWVRRTRDAILWVKSHSMAVQSSVGMQTWELVTALASIENIPLTLLIPAATKEEYYSVQRSITTQFDLDQSCTTFRSLLPEHNEVCDRKRLMQKRDRLVAQYSDVVIPISIRPDGIMSKLVEEAESTGKQIMSKWQIEHESRMIPMGYEIDEDNLTDELLSCKDRYLIHWTRASNGTWPGEIALDYYRDIVNSQRYPRGGLETLGSITRHGRIVASSRHMPGGTPCVSFSALKPCELLPLIRWRARYRQMSFEPYGIGILRETAMELGIAPVQYYDSADGPPLDTETWLTQSSGVKSDWRQEQEYRHRGDVDFSEIPKDRLICFCRTRDEAKFLQDKTGINTIPFTD